MYDWSFDDGENFVRTDLAELARYAERFDSEKLRGYIFHMSRCGSTAVANAARELQGALVISESRALSSILLPPEFGGLDIEHDERRTLSLGFIGAVAKEYPCEHVVLKCPSIMSGDIRHVLDALPAARWCFLSRKPSEIVRSMGRSPSGWLTTRGGFARAAHLVGYRESNPNPSLHDILCALLARYIRSALETHDARSLYLDYAFFNEDSIVGLAEFLWERSFDLDTLERMRRSLTYYSKARDKRAFTPDDPLPVATTGASDLDDVYAEYMQRFFPSRSEPSRVPG